MQRIKLGVVLNGPPGCGKDTIANKIVEQGVFRKHQFKDALYAHTAKHFEVDLDKFIHFASDRVLKDSKSLAGLGGRTPREALIYVSEEIYKPRYGSDYFGKVEVNRVETLCGHMDGDVNVIYPDGGFADELRCIDSCFDGVLVIRLHRDGFDFKGDSRSYVELPDTPKRKSIDVDLTAGEINIGVNVVKYAIKSFRETLRNVSQ